MKTLLSYLCPVLAVLLYSAPDDTGAAEPVANGAASPFSGELGVLFAPFYSAETVLLRQDGREWHTWKGGREPALSVRLQPDGSMLRLGGMPSPPAFKNARMAGGYLQRFSWDGALLWEFPAMTSTMIAYGDALVLPNGNILTAALEFKTREECEKMGRDPSLLTDQGMYVPALVEYRPHEKDAAFQVWKWSLWDHLYQARHPALPHHQFQGRKAGRVDLGLLPHLKGPRWLLPKEIDYLPEQDLILMMVHGSREVWVIDHSTTTQEAASETGGRRNRGGSVVAWSAAATEPGAAAQTVLSAEWKTQQSGSSATTADLIVLSYAKNGCFVDELKLNLDSMEFTTTRRLKRLEVAKNALDDLPPIIVSQGRSGEALVLGNPDSGKLSFADTTPAKSWTYKNEKGVVTMVPYRGKPGEACCGGGSDTGGAASSTTAPKTGAALPPPIQRAPTTKPRISSLMSAPLSVP
ncbi:hypothetical protein DES53_102867 [Roseimicrobium gellanilyticum]|uniref:Arylsulfotransferase ASST n=1 Tax=Roseimicrobium gellanilyticum TaxID=748857 RepID=A0A366HSK2_9BACT|nr:hypothetical protein [Roseimicrobium gellanilyticum]RBP46476.1 hypothetical protein DES53_102867 [Roseimicrobium gellanilyticum]